MQEYSYSYTKHIYAGTQRIASKLGDIEAFGADPRRVEYAGANLKEVDFGSKYEQQTKALLARYDSLGVEHRPNTLNDYVGGQSFCCGEKELVSNNQTGDNTFETPDYEQLIFFYHPDHLGSTSLVTDNSGNVVQSVAYIPYGEVFVEERNGTWNTPYLFNGKELDEETGLYYYGARYLDPTGAMWLSVDPLFEKYAGMSPYNYCAGNPVMMVDPDGEAPWILIAAGIGAAVSGGIALVQGKSLKEVGAAAVGGAVCGAVAACGGVFFEGSVVAGVVSGALGGGLGDATEQGINIATGNQKEYDGIKTLKAATVGGVVNGVATRYVNGVKSSAKKELDNAMEQKIPSQSEVDAEFLKAFDVPKKFVNKGNHSQWKTNHDNYQNLRKTALEQAKEARTSKILDKSVKINNAQTAVTYSKSKYFGGVVETVNDLTQVGTNNVINE